MTTTVIVRPHPGTGLKVEVKVKSFHADGNHHHQVEYMKNGDPERSFYASDGMSVKVSEVPDTVPVEVKGDTIEDDGFAS